MEWKAKEKRAKIKKCSLENIETMVLSLMDHIAYSFYVVDQYGWPPGFTWFPGALGRRVVWVDLGSPT